MVDIHLALVAEDEQALSDAGRPVPEPLAVAALVDTGATGGVVRTGLAQDVLAHAVLVYIGNTNQFTLSF